MMESKAFIGKKLNAAMAALVAAIVAFTLTIPAHPAYAASLEAAGSKTTQSLVDQTAKSVQAKKKSKAKKVTKHSFSTDSSTVDACALAVKKGTTKLKIKTQGYIKFTATKTKTYSFKFSGLNGCYAAHSIAQMVNESYPQNCSNVTLSTKGGKDDTLRIAKKGYAGKTGKKIYWYLSSRTGKIKLTQGQTIYFHFFAPAKSATVKLKVK